MSFLIDGYNLIYAAGIVGRGAGPGSLERSRLALLNFLAASLEPQELPHTTVVFDAHDAPSGLSRVVTHQGITVHFASKYEEADDLIEELIRANSAPRQLTVVSSDHRLQRAARRRRAKSIDSDVWYAELLRIRRQREEAMPKTPARPVVPLLEEDVNYWLRQFGGESALTEFLSRESGDKPPVAKKPSKKIPDSDDKAGPLDNPFPPGYGEDLLDEL